MYTFVLTTNPYMKWSTPSTLYYSWSKNQGIPLFLLSRQKHLPFRFLHHTTKVITAVIVNPGGSRGLYVCEDQRFRQCTLDTQSRSSLESFVEQSGRVNVLPLHLTTNTSSIHLIGDEFAREYRGSDHEKGETSLERRDRFKLL